MGNTSVKEFFSKGENLGKISKSIEYYGAEDINHEENLIGHWGKMAFKK